MASTTGSTTDTSRSATASTTGSSGDISARITEWRLSPSELKSDLDSGVAIVRTKESTAGAPTGSTDDTVLKTMVTGKLQADSDLSKASIQAEAKSGEVTLSGSAEKPEAVGRAIALALETQGVTKVTSEIKVSSSANR